MPQAPFVTVLQRWFSPANGSDQRTARIASGLVMLVGSFICIAWLLDMRIVERMIPGEATMKANTALCFLLAGGSLGLQTRQRQNSRIVWAAKGCAIAVSTIALLTLSQYLWGWNLGIDQLLFRDLSSAATRYPGRMGDNTALSFALTGLALWLRGQRSHRSDAVAQTATLCAAAIALLAVVGYAYSVKVFYQFIFYSTSMAIHTALAFLVLCGGILSRTGYRPTLTGDWLGNSVAQRLMPVAIAVPFGLGWLILYGLRANVYDAAFGLALLVVSLMFTLAIVILRNAQQINQIDYDRSRSSDRLRSSEKRLQRALQGAVQGTWNWDLRTQMLTWDDRCKAIFGLPPDFLITYEWHLNALHPEDRQRVADATTVALRDRTVFSEEYRTFGLDGTMIWVLARGKGYYDATGEAYQMSGTVLDISDRKQAEMALKQQTENLIQANRLKDEFLAALSHELRTPLNPILGWTTMIKTQKLTAAKTVEALEIIDRNVRQQIQLVDDLLDVSNAIQGNLSLKSNPVDLTSTIQSAIKTLALAAQVKGITLHVSHQSEKQGLLEPDSLYVTGDRDRLQQVFWNLLSNAIKFTSNGGSIHIELWVILRDTVRYAQVRITDSGIGIAPEFLPYVFDRFRQADGGSTRKYGGLGLGLSIVKQLVELQGGWVEIASPGLGKGSTLTVQLPLRIEPELLGAIAPSLSTDSSLPRLIPTGLRILLVDDDLDNLDLLRFLLEEYGSAVTAVTSPLQALEHIRDNAPDLIISDIGMPEMDGYEFIRQIRALPQGRQISALALTAFASQEDQQQALTAGFQTYLSKPVDPLQLLAAVAQLILS